jgi:hypothetical protein
MLYVRDDRVDVIGGVLNFGLKFMLDGIKHSCSVVRGCFGLGLHDAKRVAHSAEVRGVLHFQYECQRAMDDDLDESAGTGWLLVRSIQVSAS